MENGNPRKSAKTPNTRTTPGTQAKKRDSAAGEVTDEQLEQAAGGAGSR